jgi:methylase of polypeptide subunit release factors
MYLRLATPHSWAMEDAFRAQPHGYRSVGWAQPRGYRSVGWAWRHWCGPRFLRWPTDIGTSGAASGSVTRRLPGLSPALAAGGARILDVGTGVAALAVAWAELLPAVTVVGIDVLPRVLALAEAVVAASPAAARVVLRQQDVADLGEEARYALAWLPAPFVPEVALRVGLGRIHRALTPGGWVIVGHRKFAGDPMASAVTRFKTLAYGGTALDEEQARELLQQNGFRDIASMPTPPGAAAITVARTAQ